MKKTRTAQATESKLVELPNLVWVLTVILDHIDIVGTRQKASKPRSVGVP